MAGQYGGYAVDLVMCIDATRSMSPIIEQVKNNAMTFYEDFETSMENNNRTVSVLRVKVIVFRDYICDTDAMVESKFFTLPDESHKFRDFVSGIQATGGGDTPENALEALAYAIKSEWTNEGDKRRHAIVIFSDAPALALGERADCARYPSDIPTSMEQLSAMWDRGDQMKCPDYQPSAGRLVIFAPEDPSWDVIQSWNRAWVHHSQAGVGLNDIDIQEAIDVLVASFAAAPTGL